MWAFPRLIDRHFQGGLREPQYLVVPKGRSVPEMSQSV